MRSSESDLLPLGGCRWRFGDIRRLSVRQKDKQTESQPERAVNFETTSRVRERKEQVGRRQGFRSNGRCVLDSIASGNRVVKFADRSATLFCSKENPYRAPNEIPNTESLT
jgi:hypothetical protein